MHSKFKLLDQTKGFQTTSDCQHPKVFAQFFYSKLLAFFLWAKRAIVSPECTKVASTTTTKQKGLNCRLAEETRPANTNPKTNGLKSPFYVVFRPFSLYRYSEGLKKPNPNRHPWTDNKCPRSYLTSNIPGQMLERQLKMTNKLPVQLANNEPKSPQSRVQFCEIFARQQTERLLILGATISKRTLDVKCQR